MLFAAVLLTALAIDGRFPRRALLALALTGLYLPVFHELALGQVDMLLLLCLTAAIWAAASGRQIMAGATLSLATAVQLFPGALVVYFAYRRQWWLLA